MKFRNVLSTLHHCARSSTKNVILHTGAIASAKLVVGQRKKGESWGPVQPKRPSLSLMDLLQFFTALTPSRNRIQFWSTFLFWILKLNFRAVVFDNSGGFIL